ncbi:MAG: HAD family hydrolase [Gemmatales bacterium]|nr:HAD family hydrolase [Gemmatales bacterium]MDW8221381.1 HAD family hydrolase [Gemmatales bacterium]
MRQLPCSVHAVIFDFDGTLADSFEAIACSVNHVRAQYGLPPLAIEEVRMHVGRGALHLLCHTVPGVNPQQALERYRQHHEQIMRPLTRLMPGTEFAISQLKRAGLKLAVCSNKPVYFTRELLEHFLAPCSVDAVLGPEDVPRPKPAPDMLLEALRRLGVAPGHAVYVGDMDVDIQAARQAGIAVLAVPTGAQSAEYLASCQPDGLLASLAELPDYLQRYSSTPIPFGTEPASSGSVR